MIELPLIFLGGLLGSSHCIGMCGGFALTVGLGARGLRANLARQLVYSAGRIFSYGFLGCVAGFAGFWFARRSGAFVPLQAGLSLVAGVLLVAQGLLGLGLFPGGIFRRSAPPRRSSCLAGTFLGTFLMSPRVSDVFVAGLLNGLLPCGLVYGYLSLASSAASLPAGLATMIAFGLGTVPAMVLTGAGASVVSVAARHRLHRIAAVCVLLTGVLAIARGVAFLAVGSTAQCPACLT
jgi:sulfite exporter TauE/SafE